jgi:hypothetical protein
MFEGLTVLRTLNRVQMHGRLQLVAALALLLLGGLGVAGCGVRGSLEAPAGTETKTGDATPGKPGTPVPHKSSILDPLIR